MQCNAGGGLSSKLVIQSYQKIIFVSDSKYGMVWYGLASCTVAISIENAGERRRQNTRGGNQIDYGERREKR